LDVALRVNWWVLALALGEAVAPSAYLGATTRK
jgi:hypothetical protein